MSGQGEGCRYRSQPMVERGLFGKCSGDCGEKACVAVLPEGRTAGLGWICPVEFGAQAENCFREPTTGKSQTHSEAWGKKEKNA